MNGELFKSVNRELCSSFMDGPVIAAICSDTPEDKENLESLRKAWNGFMGRDPQRIYLTDNWYLESARVSYANVSVPCLYAKTSWGKQYAEASIRILTNCISCDDIDTYSPEKRKRV